MLEGRRAVFIGEVIVIFLDTEEMMVDGVEEGGKNLGGTYSRSLGYRRLRLVILLLDIETHLYHG